MRRLIIFLAMVWILPWTSGAASNEGGYICSVQLENDFFGGGTDRHFTHGTRVSCLTKPIPWITAAADRLPWLSTKGALENSRGTLRARASVSLGQNIYTPEDITAYELIKEDRPYAGWLYMGFGLVTNQGYNRYDKVELDIGVVGPLSFAEEVQRNWHSLFGLRQPKGWDHQMNDELGLVLFYEQARRFHPRETVYGLQCDAIPHFGGSLGNVFTYAATGLTLRLGRDLEGDFGAPRIRPSLPGGGHFRHEKGFNWYGFVGIEGRAVLHNIFLDGNTFSDSHSVDKKPLVGDVQMGLAVQLDSMRVTYTQIYRTKEYEGQDSADQFGALSLSYQF